MNIEMAMTAINANDYTREVSFNPWFLNFDANKQLTSKLFANFFAVRFDFCIK